VRYSSILVSALLLSSIYVISSTPALADDENVVTAAADDISAASGSNRFVVWQDNTCPPIKCTAQNDIFFRRSTDNGATWKAVVNLSNNTGSSVDPQIAVSGSNVYVVWQDTTPGNFDILSRRSADSGSTWKSVGVSNLSKNTGNSISPQVAG